MDSDRARKITDAPPVALRRSLAAYFSDAELQTLAHDVGIDYEELPGQTKSAKIVHPIQTAARRGTILDLIALCQAERPNADWSAIHAAATANAQQFLRAHDETPPLLTASPDRALKIGIVLGALMMLLLACGFGGGLLAGQVVRVTLNPIQPDLDALGQVIIRIENQQFTPQGAGISFARAMQIIGNLPAGASFALQLDDVQATTIVAEVTKGRPDAPARDPHIRFLANGQITVNVRVRQLGDRRVALAYTARAEGGRIVITPASAWVNLVEVSNTTFGWFPLPQPDLDDVTRWAQAQLDAATRDFWFDDVTVGEDKLTLAGTKR
jgi:hypothetical protein